MSGTIDSSRRPRTTDGPGRARTAKDKGLHGIFGSSGALVYTPKYEGSYYKDMRELDPEFVETAACTMC